MRGSHAPSLRSIARRTLREEIMLPRGARLVCACSGGPDSNALLHVLAGLREELGLEALWAEGVDHGLRGEAAVELELAAALARDLGVPFGVTRVTVGAGANLQARAREARYAALGERMRQLGAGFLATAHTADDRAETVLLRLLRGAGARGLAVLPARDGDRIRPLIRARREAVLLHLDRQRVPFARDPSNLDTRFARVRVRTQIMPALAAESPHVAETLCRLADELASIPAPDEAIAGLGRGQREQLERALRTGKPAKIRISDCKEVLVALERGAPVITEHVTLATRKQRRGSPRT